MTKRYISNLQILVSNHIYLMLTKLKSAWWREYHIIDAFHFTHFSSSSSNGQSRSPNAQPYSFDDYYYYDYDYDYEPKAKKPKLVTKAAPPPKRKTSSNLYPTYKRPPR